MLSGQPVYQVPIGGISANGEVSFPISFTYAGSVRQIYDADNDRGPTSWIGYGWNFSAPSVSVNHKGTLTIDDDVFYCNLGPYGGGQILKNYSNKYFILSDPSIKVFPQMDAESLIYAWQFQTAQGVKLFFGKNGTDLNAARTLIRIGNTIAASSYTLSSATDYIYKWDLYKISDYSEKNALQFRYEKPAAAFGTKSFTRESYLHDIIWNDKFGNEIEKYVFTNAEKTVDEYSPGTFEPEFEQKLYETKHLIKIDRFHEGTLQQTWNINTDLRPKSPGFPFIKRRLTGVSVSYPNPRGGLYTDPKSNWTFDYNEELHRHSGLQTIHKPFFGIDSFEYRRFNYSQFGYWGYYTKQDQNYHYMKDQNGSDILISETGPDISTKWTNQSSCSERFCLLTATHLDVSMSEVFLEVWMNNGNYFKTAPLGAQKAVFRKFFSVGTANQPVSVIPWNDNFLVVNSFTKSIILYEWNGTTFNEITNIIKRDGKNSIVNDPITNNNPFTGTGLRDPLIL